VQSGFVFDVAIDETLFSTDPPAGYTDVAAQEPAKVDEQPGKQAEQN
jgi:hypothetical protein